MVRRKLAMAVLFGTLVPGCIFGGGRAATPTPTPVPGGILKIAISDDIGALDPQLVSEPAAFGLVRATQRGLMTFSGGSSHPEPDLASERPMVSADGLTYVFQLRPGIAFGSPASRRVEARDVKAGLERLFAMRPDLARYFPIVGAAERLRGKATGLAGVTAPDASTVRIQLVRPANDLEWMLAMPQASAVPAGLPVAVAWSAISPSGPYRLAAYDPGRSIRLERNPVWSAASDPTRKAWVDEILATVGSAPGADIGDAGVAAPSGATEVSFTNGCLQYLFMNTKVAPFDSFAVRRGVALAIDRARLVSSIRSGTPGPGEKALGTAAWGLLASGIEGAAGGSVKTPEAALARSLVGRPYTVRAGWEHVGSDAAVDGKVATAVWGMLTGAGVTVRALANGLSAAPASIYDAYEVPARKVQMGIARWCPDWPGRAGRAVIGALLDGRWISSGGNTDYSMTSDSTLNRLIDVATAEQDPAQVATRWRAAEERSLVIASIVPLVFLDEVVTVSPRLRGFSPSPLLARGDPTNVWLAD